MIKRLFFGLVIFSAISSFAMEVSDPEYIFHKLENEIALTKGNEEGLNELLRRERKIGNDAEKEGAENKHEIGSLELLVNYLHQTPSYAQLRDKFDIILQQIPEEKLPSEKIEELVSKLLVLAIGSKEILNYFGPLLRRYEECIKKYHSNEISQRKALSFFCLFIINKILFERAVLKQEPKKENKPGIKREIYKQMRRVSSNKIVSIDTNKSDEKLVRNENIICLTQLIQKRVVTGQAVLTNEQSSTLNYIDGTLILLNNIILS